MDRRRFLLLAATAPLLLSTSAEAALKMPTKVPPARVQPLGTFTLVDSRPTIEVGDSPVTTDIQLLFRSAIDVAVPYINIWPPRIPLPPLPPPAPPVPGVPRTPIPIGSEYRPRERVFGTEVDPGVVVPTELVAGVFVPVVVQIPIAARTCTTSFRVTVQMSDGPTDTRRPVATQRRALYSFVLRVVGEQCYTGRVADPLVTTGRAVNARPTSKPRPTSTAAIDRNSPVYLTRLARFRTPTP